MGWNDHVEVRTMRCRKCGEEDAWEFWDLTAVERYGGGLDKALGHDVKNNGACPHCGSKLGDEVEEDDDW